MRNFKRNKVKVDLASYPLYLIQGVPKVGKTSLMYDLAEYVYGTTDAMLLLDFADENGFNHLDDVIVEKINHWESVPKKALKINPDEIALTKLVDDLVKNKDEYGFKMIVFDTFDKEVTVAIEEVARLHFLQNQAYPKSLNDSLGGYGKGRDKVLDLLLDPIKKLRNAGYAIFVLSHTKLKSRDDITLDQKYEVLTTALRDDFYNCYSGIAQMIVTINVERDINAEGRETAVADFKTKKKKGVVLGEKRMMHFRSDGTVDCGCRFKEVPYKLELSAENFMKAFEQGVKSSMKNKLTDEEIEVRRKEELVSLDENAKLEVENLVDREENKKLLAEISKLFTSATNAKKTKAKKLVKEFGLVGFEDTNFPTKDIQAIYDALN